MSHYVRPFLRPHNRSSCDWSMQVSKTTRRDRTTVHCEQCSLRILTSSKFGLKASRLHFNLTYFLPQPQHDEQVLLSVGVYRAVSRFSQLTTTKLAGLSKSLCLLFFMEAKSAPVRNKSKSKVLTHTVHRFLSGASSTHSDDIPFG